MKTIFSFLIYVAFISSAYALPQCRDGDETKWQNCQGTLVSGTGKEYVGVFKDGIFDGNNYEHQIRYVGQYKNGMNHGRGTTTFADGRKYVGEFKDGKYHGQGTMTNADGSKYVGKFKDNKYHGQGTLTLADGSEFVGGFKDGELDGQGTLTRADGIKFVGEFKDGELDGQGTVTMPDGSKYVGEFKEGQLLSQKKQSEAKNNNQSSQEPSDNASPSKFQDFFVEVCIIEKKHPKSACYCMARNLDKALTYEEKRIFVKSYFGDSSAARSASFDMIGRSVAATSKCADEILYDEEIEDAAAKERAKEQAKKQACIAECKEKEKIWESLEIVRSLPLGFDLCSLSVKNGYPEGHPSYPAPCVQYIRDDADRRAYEVAARKYPRDKFGYGWEYNRPVCPCRERNMFFSY